jgi:hypothetical protein
MSDKPKIENAPGLVLRKRKNGWSANWQARTDIIARGYTPKFRRIMAITHEPSEMECAFISDQCNLLQDDMMKFARGGLPVVGQFDGTVASLVACYQTDPDSPFNKKLRYRSRKNYESFLKRIIGDIGHEHLADLKARQVLRWHEELMKRGTPMAHGTINIFRAVLTFGAGLLDDPTCRDVREIMKDLKFPMGKRRTSILTADQAIAIRNIAHAKGMRSIALAQAIQFEAMLRQRDVIGEWVPSSEPGISDVFDGNKKLIRGIRWEEITEEAGKLMLRHVTSKRQKLVEIDLKLAPMVMEEFVLLGERPRSGPVIVCEAIGVPYDENMFRLHWRRIANEAGIPKTVRNMDTRAGAISEATDAGASLEHVRHAATHSDIATTQGYSRDGEVKTAQVLKQRVEYRNKKGTTGA